MAGQISFKERVRQVLIANSRAYKYYYVDYEYLLCSPAFHNREYYIVAANEDNYLHLTGVHSNLSAQDFFNKCYDGTLKESDFVTEGTYKGNDLKGSIRRKINVLPNIPGLFSSGPQIQEDFQKNRVICSFAAGMTSCTIGFTRTARAYPETLLKGNLLDQSSASYLSLVLRRSSGSDKFGEILVGGDDELLGKYEALKDLLSDRLSDHIKVLMEERQKVQEQKEESKELPKPEEQEKTERKQEVEEQEKSEQPEGEEAQEEPEKHHQADDNL